MRKIIYVAGPMTKGSMAHNVGQAVRAAVELIKRGFAPHVPHLWFYVEVHHDLTWSEMMEVDEPAVRSAAAVLRLPGESTGADRECEWARAAGIPVFHSVAEIVERVLP